MSIDWYTLIAPAGVLAFGLVGYGLLRHRYASLEAAEAARQGQASEARPAVKAKTVIRQPRPRTTGGGGGGGGRSYPKEDKHGRATTFHSPSK